MLLRVSWNAFHIVLWDFVVEIFYEVLLLSHADYVAVFGGLRVWLSRISKGTLRASAAAFGLLFHVLVGLALIRSEYTILVLIAFVGQIIMKIVFIWFELGVN